VTRALKVLVIDDDPIVLETIRERLSRRAYDVTTRDQALGSTHAVRAARPDILLLDVLMPVLNGDHLAELLRADPGAYPVSIILHSTKPADELADLVRQTGALGAIQKTSDAESFISEFDALAAKHVPPEN
jgi:CheY-like chemotaxis protein